MPASTFLSVFAKSPIKPIEEHIRKVHQASELLIPFFDAVYQQDWQQAADVRKNIVALEKEADKLKREIRINLPRGLFLPVDRTDILELVSQQDKIANKTKDITGRVLGRELLIPASLQQDFKTYVQRCIDATALASEVINELDELLETGFRGREVDLVIKMVEQLDAIEDAIQVTEGIFEWLTSSFVQVGMTEYQIYRGIQTLIDERGYGYGWERAGNPIVNCGPDSQAGHGLPSNQIALGHGHILHIDLGVATRKYSSDIQRCWYVGSYVPEHIQQAMAAVVSAIDAAAAALVAVRQRRDGVEQDQRGAIDAEAGQPPGIAGRRHHQQPHRACHRRQRAQQVAETVEPLQRGHRCLCLTASADTPCAASSARSRRTPPGTAASSPGSPPPPRRRCRRSSSESRSPGTPPG